MPTRKPNKSVDTTAPAKFKTRRLWPKLIILMAMLGIAAVLVSLLPRGYSQDTSLIGKGGNIVVLFHDPFSVASSENMNAMNILRDEYDGRVIFLVADKNVQQGIKFTETHGMDSPAFIFFAPNGEKINVVYPQQNAESLRKNINKAFHF